MYLSRLKRYDSQLHFVVNLTEERARKQAQDLDAEISRGKYRGPLHGIPWGAKDLLAVKGYPTTWGAGLYQNQTFDYDAPVVTRLDDAGAILVAKLTLGSLAQGDRWWKERTRNPWNPETGVERLVGRTGVGDSGGMRRLQHRLGDERLDHVAVAHVRRRGLPSVVRPRAAHRRDGALVDDRQARPDLPQRGRLRARLRRDPGPRRHRLLGQGVSVQLEREPKLSQLKIAYIKADFERTPPDGTTTPIAEAMNFLKVLESLGAKPEPIDAPTPNYGYLDYDHSERRMRRRVRARHAERPDQGAGAVQQLAEHVPHRAVHSGGGLRQRQSRPHARHGADVGAVLEVRRRRHAAGEHVGHEHHRHAVDRRADRLRDSPVRPGRRWRRGRRRARGGGGRGGDTTRADAAGRAGGTAAADRSASDRHVHHGPHLSGREEPARRARVPAGDGLPQEASAAVR